MTTHSGMVTMQVVRSQNSGVRTRDPAKTFERRITLLPDSARDLDYGVRTVLVEDGTLLEAYSQAILNSDDRILNT